jgi:MFS family permease
MKRDVSFWLAWSLAGISLAMYAAAFVFAFLTLGVDDPVKQVSIGDIGGLLVYLPFLAFPIVGALIASKRPRNTIGWICLVTGMFWMSFALGEASNAYELARTGTVTSSVTLDALLQASWALPVGLLGIYMILLFPDGRLPSRRWRPFAVFAGAVIVLIPVVFVLAPGYLEGHPGVRNPFGLEQYPWLKLVTILVVLLLPLCILISALSLVLRYRRSGAEVREQIKWLAFAALIVGVTYLSALVVGIFFVPTLVSGGDKTPVWYSLLLSFMLMSFAGVPIAIGFAVLKYRLYDIDIIINRALVYGPLTISLVAVYLGGVVGTQAAFRTLTGQEHQTQLAVVVSTLAIAAMFNPLRRRIQYFIDRRFYRRKYDAARIMAAYGTRLRDEVDLKTLSDDLLAVVRDTVQPVHVNLWLRSPDRTPPAGKRKA